MAKPHLLNSAVFKATVLIVPTVILIIYLTGLHNHRTFYLNSLISTTVLSFVFLSFITLGLYNGWKLKDTLGDFRKKITMGKIPENTELHLEGLDLDVDEGGIVAIVIAFLFWLIVGVFGSLLLWLAGGVIWAVVLIVTGLLYWIVFRAFRLVFKHSSKCRGNITRSFTTAVLYTFVYNFWIYSIVLVAARS